MSIRPFHLFNDSLRLCLVLALCNAAWAADTLPDLVNSGKYSEALEMIAAGANVNEPSADGTTALHWAAYRKEADLVERLLAEGADPNIRNDYGATPLTVASEFGELNIMKALVDANGDIESPLCQHR